MRRREFLSSLLGAAMVHTNAFATANTGGTGIHPLLRPVARQSTGNLDRQNELKPMAIGVMIRPAHDNPEAAISVVKRLGMTNCILDLDDWIGRFSPSGAKGLNTLLEKYGVTATSVEIVGPDPLVWKFLDGPATIGLVPPATRAARMDALKQTSDFAKQMGILRVQTHCGFLPENHGTRFTGKRCWQSAIMPFTVQGTVRIFLWKRGRRPRPRFGERLRMSTKKTSAWGWIRPI